MKEIISLAAGVFLLYWPYFWCWYRKENPADYGLSWSNKKKDILQTLFVSAAVLLLLTPVALMWPWDSLPHRRTLYEALNLPAAGLAAAVIEETFFRGWLQTIIKKYLPVSAAVLLTNMIFAPIHLIAAPNIISLTTFFPGVIMSILRERYGNILPSVIFHFVGNIWAIWFFPIGINLKF